MSGNNLLLKPLSNFFRHTCRSSKVEAVPWRLLTFNLSIWDNRYFSTVLDFRTTNNRSCIIIFVKGMRLRSYSSTMDRSSAVFLSKYMLFTSRFGWSSERNFFLSSPVSFCSLMIFRAVSSSTNLSLFASHCISVALKGKLISRRWPLYRKTSDTAYRPFARFW